ncbi:MAG: amidohydrolase family protein [Acidobacteria bacterium]|nr:amidohydrolase family protein [Acidobacteriota bacterium]
MRIDSHHHFWQYSPAEYGWMTDALAVIRRDFGPADLQREIEAAGIDGVVSVQARQTLEENDALLAHAEAHDFIQGVVGWVPLIDPNVGAELEKLAQRPKLKGVRHVLHDEADDDYMLRADFNRGIAMLKDLGLVYDILIFEKHLPQTLMFVDRHPGQVFVVDHVAKPKIKAGETSPWRERIAELAERPNVYCKVSGMATEADFQAWTPEQLKPYFETVLSCFGPKRLMFGSDWPVCKVAVEYGRWAQIVRDWVNELSEDEQARILGSAAVEAYGL